VIATVPLTTLGEDERKQLL